MVVQHEYDHLEGILIDVKGRTFSQERLNLYVPEHGY